MKNYEFIEHTADIGIRIYGKNLKDLFKNAAQALFTIITKLEKVGLEQEKIIELQEDSLEDLFIEWLRELLYQFNAEGFISKEIVINDITDQKMCAFVKGDTFNPKILTIETEIKAVTYHNLKVKRINSGWQAEVVLDV